jgi:hypothetical protein
MRRGTVLVRMLWVATTIGAIGMVALVATMLAAVGEGPGLAFLFCMLAVDVIAFSTMAVLIERRRPGNRIAWVLAAAGALLVLAFSGFGIGAYRFVLYGEDDLVGGFFALIGGATLGPALFTAVPLLAILFPDGRLPGLRWRYPLAATVAAIVVSSAVGAIQPGPVNNGLPVNPLGIDSELVVALGQITAPLLPLGILAGAVLAIAAVATRFRRSSGLERQQVKWLLAAVTAIGALLPASFIGGADGFNVFDALAMGSLALLPLSVGLAVLRYRLYEIDRLVSRTLGWVVVTVVLAAVFTIAVVGLQALLAPITANNTLAVAASTLVAAALFQPLRGRVQRAVDRRFNRSRISADGAVSAFAAHVRNEVDLSTLRTTLVATARDAVHPTGAALWLRPNADARR